MTLRVLAVSDQIDPRIHSATLRQRMPDIDIVVAAGDLPSRYLEFLADALERPVYYVLGNHMEEWVKDQQSGKIYQPMGAQSLSGRVIYDKTNGIIIAGMSGSPKYSGEGGQQFTEFQVYSTIARMIPKLVWNRLRRGRWVDLLITHAPRAMSTTGRTRPIVALLPIAISFHCSNRDTSSMGIFISTTATNHGRPPLGRPGLSMSIPIKNSNSTSIRQPPPDRMRMSRCDA